MDTYISVSLITYCSPKESLHYYLLEKATPENLLFTFSMLSYVKSQVSLPLFEDFFLWFSEKFCYTDLISWSFVFLGFIKCHLYVHIYTYMHISDDHMNVKLGVV